MEMSQTDGKAFDNALSNFTFGMANRDLICHMAAEGYSVRQIKEATDYPVSVEKIAETVWEYYIETGVIRLRPPGGRDEAKVGSDDPEHRVLGRSGEGEDRRYEYVMDIGKFGRRSFRRVETGTENKPETEAYIPCAFGVTKAHDPALYRKQLEALDSRKRDYIDGLPWPDQTVWHIDNLLIREIFSILSEKGIDDSGRMDV